VSNNPPGRRIFKLSLFLLLVFFCLYFFLHSSIFKVDKIYVSGARQVPQSQIIKMAGVVPGNNIFLVNEKACQRGVEAHPLIKSAVMVRHLPRQVEIKVEERKVWALIPYKEALLCIDEEGVCIDKSVNFSLVDHPVVTFSKMPAEVGIGQVIYPDAIKMISGIWSRLSPEARRDISDFHYDIGSRELVINTEEGTEIRWGDASRPEEKLAHLEQVIKLEKDIARQGKDSLQYIDLRFEGQPVLKTRALKAGI